MRNTDVIIFIFTDETSETGNESSSTISTNQKSTDWSTQVDNEQQQEADYSTDSMSQSNTLPKDGSERGRRRRRRNKSRLLMMCESVLATNTYAFVFLFSI
jgi:hypothetical protein